MSVENDQNFWCAVAVNCGLLIHHLKICGTHSRRCLHAGLKFLKTCKASRLSREGKQLGFVLVLTG